jgi:hypothetical protein
MPVDTTALPPGERAMAALIGEMVTERLWTEAVSLGTLDSRRSECRGENEADARRKSD